MVIFVNYVFVNAQKVVHPRGLNHMSFVISAVTTTQCSMKKLEKLSWKKNLANNNFVIYVFVNAKKVVHPRGLNHICFLISAVTTTQYSMKKLEKLSWQKNHANHNFVIYVFVNAQKVVHPRGLNHMSFVISAVTTTQCSMRKLEKLSFMDF